MAKLKYTIQRGDFTRKELEKEGAGGCDALVLISICRHGKPAHSGDVSFVAVTADGVVPGESKVLLPPIPSTELFSAWAMLAKDLAEDKGCLDWQRKIAKIAFGAVRHVLTGGKK